MGSYDFSEMATKTGPAKLAEPNTEKKEHTLNIEDPRGLNNPVFRKDSLEELKEREKKRASNGQEDDAWDAAMPEMDAGPPWNSLSVQQKSGRIISNICKILAVFGLLYLFICSLDLLSSAFKLISGKTASNLMGGEYMSNPVVGLMVGILLTVLVQSSSTSTSIIVSMVSAGLLTVHDAIPIIMGSNVGTSVTNTIVSLTQASDRNMFRRAFAGATVHDMFNWLAVIVLLTVEILTGLLEKLTGAIVHSVSQNSGGEVKILKVITEPFTDLIISLDSSVLRCWGLGEWMDKDSMITEFCSYTFNNTDLSTTESPPSTVAIVLLGESSTESASGICPIDYTEVGLPDSCHFLFYNTNMSDTQIGIILLVLSLVILCSALIIIVKLLNSMLKGSIAIVIKKTLNADVPYVPWLTGYIALLIGAVMTFIVQSSSIFTSTLTPLIGIGIITVERAYPLTLGSNIGTTTTALLASLAGEGQGLTNAVQIALVHLFFNVFGILIFYPIPFMRFPIPMCKFLGNVTASYRWFAIVYLIFMFFLMPSVVFLLSLGGPLVLWGVLGPLIVILAVISIINIMQNKKMSLLPKFLHTWEFLPAPMRSLEPYDKVMTSLPCCKSCREQIDEPLEEVVQDSSRNNSVVVKEKKGVENQAMAADI